MSDEDDLNFYMPPQRVTAMQMYAVCHICGKKVKKLKYFWLPYKHGSFTDIGICKKCAEEAGKDWENPDYRHGDV